MIQIAVTIAVIILYSRSFLRKEESNITILNVKENEHLLIDLKENKQVIILNPYLFDINPNQLFPGSAFYVVKNTATGEQTKTPLPLKACTDLETDISELSDKFQPGELIPF